MNKKIYFEKNINFETNDVDNKLVIFDENGDDVYILEKIERYIYNKIIVDKVCYDELIVHLKQLYVNENIREDVDEYISELIKNNIILKKEE